MARYILKRLFLIILIVLVVIFILFIMLYILPGSRIREMPIYENGDALDSIFNTVGARDGIFTKYIRYCYNILFHFDFGRSSTTKQPLFWEMSYRIRNTMIVLFCSVLVTLAAGIPAGVYMSVHRNRWSDRLYNIVTLILASIPSYALALVLALILAVHFRILPLQSSGAEAAAFVLPTLTIALGGIASIARMTRASMLEVLEQPYITALRAKGVRESEVICRHALKNALVPVISALGGYIAQLLCWTFVVENFFNILGIGSLMLRAVSTRDHFEILGCVTAFTVILSLTNIAADILYMSVNPRIKLRNIRSRNGRQGNEVAK